MVTHPPRPHVLTEAEADALFRTLTFAHKRHDAPESVPMLVHSPASFVRDRLEDLTARVLAACRGTIPSRADHNPFAYALTLND